MAPLPLEASFLVDIRKLTEPEFMDGLASVKISEAQFQMEAQKYKSALLGRVSFLPKSDRLSLNDLKRKLTVEWSLESGWDITYLGKGYYVVRFASEVDRRKIWVQGIWHLHPGKKKGQTAMNSGPANQINIIYSNKSKKKSESFRQTSAGQGLDAALPVLVPAPTNEDASHCPSTVMVENPSLQEGVNTEEEIVSSSLVEAAKPDSYAESANLPSPQQLRNTISGSSVIAPGLSIEAPENDLQLFNSTSAVAFSDSEVEGTVASFINRPISLPSPEEVRDAVLHLSEKVGQLGNAASVPLSEEVRNAREKAWLQMEHDLTIIAAARKSDHCLDEQPLAPMDPSSMNPPPHFNELSETQMEQLMTISRSLKQLSNKKKHMRNKVKVSLSKNKHNYLLRGISLQAK